MRILRDHALIVYAVGRRLELGLLWSIGAFLALRVTLPLQEYLRNASDPLWGLLATKAILWTVFFPPMAGHAFMRYTSFQNLAQGAPTTMGWFADWLLATVLIGALMAVLLPSILRVVGRFANS